eukprot:scaffold19632_cov53-Phaeocystis_antarctica.AAC.1
MRDSVLPRQLGPSAGRAVGPPAVAAAVFGAGPPVLGQVGAYKHSTECRAVCTTKCTEGKLALVNNGETLELTKLSEYGPYSEASVTTLRVPSLLVAPVQGEEEHGPPPGTVLVSVRKEGNTPPCMKPLVIRLAVPVHRASSERARRYALGGGGGGGGGKGGGDGGGGDGDGDGGGGLGDGGGGLGEGGGGEGLGGGDDEGGGGDSDDGGGLGGGGEGLGGGGEGGWIGGDGEGSRSSSAALIVATARGAAGAACFYRWVAWPAALRCG